MVHGAPPDQLVAWAAEAEAEFRRAQADDVAARRASCRVLVRGAAQRRPGLLYRWIRGEVRAPPAAVAYRNMIIL